MTIERYRLSRVRSRVLSAAFDIRHGGRMVSLFDTTTDREWLVQPSGFDVATYGSSFTRRHIHGWDEMLPTIDACKVLGVDLPDHGELWAVPWRRRPAHSVGGLRLVVDAAAMPLRFVREISPSGDDLLLDYELTNFGANALPVLWTAHPQFQVTSQAQVLFPTSPAGVEIVSPPQRAGFVEWSRATEMAAQQPEGSHLKVSLGDCDQLQTVTLRDRRSALTLQWHSGCVRHLAVLWDHAQFSSERVIALEPSTSSHSSLARAIAHGDATTVHRGETLRWSIILSVPGTGSSPDSARQAEDGALSPTLEGEVPNDSRLSANAH